MKGRVVKAFRERYREPPEFIIRSPGRVNLIGEHTDYNDGFVLPMAIDRAVWLALRPRSDDRVVVDSLDQDAPADFRLSRFEHAKEGWAEYVKGMAKMLLDAGHELKGWEAVLASDVPVGSGLSSSAALEMAIAHAFASVSGFSFAGVEMARLGQRAENEWVGARTGIMDQMISANGKAGFAMLIDCRSLSIRAVPLPPETVVLIMDTMTRHAHTESGYNERRRSCERAAEFFDVAHLRDLELDRLTASASELDDVTFRRARHVLCENARVLTAVTAMQQVDPAALGRLMNESHASLRDDFEVTNDELDCMVQIARGLSGCFGARMTGGGFGGCAIALVARREAEKIEGIIAAEYEAATGIEPHVFVAHAAQGTALA